MAIYLDAVWLLNFLLDYMLLLLTDKLAKLHTSRYRLAFGALVASLIVPLSIYYPDSFFTSVIGKVIFSIFIMTSSFGYKTIYRLVKLLTLFYMMSFAIGGGLIALHFLIHQPITVSGNGFITYNRGFGDPLSWLFIVVCFPLVWIFTKQRMDKHVQEKIRYDATIPVTLKMNGVSHSTKSFIDSGNQLVDPFTKKPVIICDETFLAHWFDKEDWGKLKIAHEALDMDKIPDEWVDRLRIIPYQGVEGGNGFLFTIIPDEITIYYDKKEIYATNFLVGIQFGNLTGDGSYHCLLQPELIKTAIHYSA
ncbi:sigma-E processing peptidase SpoIIGA [Oceanobacillus alkalisoli]|uniref:sigma-E processing peptidase SpoIIGA n=1 Tax=Oceanobacillus alkalisoli TaxID=2925113 RepID=UPI001EE4DC65|nr:sigma-E processing peptidase SpoIIGA [Oceanobacillus alkalisoli]MCG5103570.1 sigma-E processing peptidase SpoIIGA [Oceanobacillus alkalisoli]